MNKLLKYLLVGIAVFSVGVACTKAENVSSLTTYIDTVDTNVNGHGYYTVIQLNDSSDYGTYCIDVESISSDYFSFGFNTTLSVNQNHAYNIYSDRGSFYACLYSNQKYIYLYNQSSNTVNLKFKLFKLNALMNTQLPVYTSLQCQTEYNLIPISEVTANYCRLNFDLIDPMECPINSGTGTIVWSNLTINDTPYAQNQNINVFIPDFLAWNISFNDYTTAIEVEGYNADTEYIENVINNEKLTPTPEEFGKLLQTLVNFVPYLFIGLLIIYFVKVLNKVRK